VDRQEPAALCGLLDLVPRIPLPNTSARLRTVIGAGRINPGTGTSLIISNDVSFDFDGSISGAGALNKYGPQALMHRRQHVQRADHRLGRLLSHGRQRAEPGRAWSMATD
jgi:hypothetical protein